MRKYIRRSNEDLGVYLIANIDTNHKEMVKEIQ